MGGNNHSIKDIMTYIDGEPALWSRRRFATTFGGNVKRHLTGERKTSLPLPRCDGIVPPLSLVAGVIMDLDRFLRVRQRDGEVLEETELAQNVHGVVGHVTGEGDGARTDLSASDFENDLMPKGGESMAGDGLEFDVSAAVFKVVDSQHVGELRVEDASARTRIDKGLGRDARVASAENDGDDGKVVRAVLDIRELHQASKRPTNGIGLSGTRVMTGVE